MKEYLRPDEVAEKLKISKKTVYKLINEIENPMPSVRIGGQLRIKTVDLEKYVDECENKVWE